MVSNAGGAAGFPFPPVDATHVAPVAGELIAGLAPACSRLLIAQTGDTLLGWVHIQRNPNQLVAHWGTISHLQTLPSSRGGTGLEDFYARLSWRVTGRWPGALRLASGDDRDEILMILTPL